jgi:hypothetical protein
VLSVASAPRAQPLTPGAVLALGSTSLSLATRLLALPDARLEPLRAVLGDELLLLLGPESDLPWSDGVTYLGREPSAPELWLPCAIEPNVPAVLLLRALRSRFDVASLRAPFAVSLEPPLLVPLLGARPLTRALLDEFRAGAKKP